MIRHGMRILLFVILTVNSFAGFHEDYLKVRRQLISLQLKMSGPADAAAYEARQEQLYRELLAQYDPAALSGEDQRIAIRMLLDLGEYRQAWTLLEPQVTETEDQWLLAAAAECQAGAGDLAAADQWLDRMNQARTDVANACMGIGRMLMNRNQEAAAARYLRRAALVPTLDPRVRRQVSRKLLELYENQLNSEAALSFIASMTKASYLTTAEKEELMAEARRIRMAGANAPDLVNVIRWLHTDELRLTDLKGSVVVLDFFAPWCGPCIRSFPELKRMRNELKEKGLKVIGVTRLYGNYRDDRTVEKNVSEERELALIQAFVDRHELDWPIAVARNADGAFEDYQVRSIPRLVVLDREGRIRATFVGFDPSGKARRFIEKLLAE